MPLRANSDPKGHSMSYTIEITAKDATTRAHGRAIILITKTPRGTMRYNEANTTRALRGIAHLRTATSCATRTGCMVEVEFDDNWNATIRNLVLNHVMKSFGEQEGVDVAVVERDWDARDGWYVVHYRYFDPNSGWR